MSLRQSISLLIWSCFPLILQASSLKYEMITLESQDKTVHLEYPQFNEAWLNELIEKHSLEWFNNLVHYKAVSSNKGDIRFFSDKIDVLYQSKNVVVLESCAEERRQDYSDYEALRSYRNIDLTSQEELSLTDVFKPEMIDQMMEYGEKAFRKELSLSDRQSLIHKGSYFENGFRLPKAFALTEKGVRFTYNQNELLPFSKEIVDIVIPYQEMMECQSQLKPLREWIDL